MVRKKFIGFLCAAIGILNVLGQCAFQYDSAGSVIQTGKGKFSFLNGGNDQDSLVASNTLVLEYVKANDSVAWQWFSPDKLVIFSWNPAKTGKKYSGICNIVTVEKGDGIMPRVVQVKLPAGYKLMEIGSESLLFYNLISNAYMKADFAKISGNKMTAVATENSGYKFTEVKKVSVPCGLPVYNPHGPAEEIKRKNREAFSRDSLISFPLALMKKSIIEKGGNMLWDLQRVMLDKYSDSSFADVFDSAREIHQVELYVEDRHYNDATVYGKIRCEFPGLFEGKNTQIIPFYKKNGVRGYQFSWHTMTMLEFRFIIGLKKEAPALWVIRSSANPKIVGNALYPEELFMEDSTFREIYSKEDPVAKAKEILGHNCIQAGGQCNTEWLAYAMKDWFGRADCYLDTVIKIRKSSGDVRGMVTPKFKNLIVVHISSTAPSELGIRKDSTAKWNFSKLYPMYDYPANRIYNASAELNRKLDSYEFLVPYKQSEEDVWVLFFSKEKKE